MTGIYTGACSPSAIWGKSLPKEPRTGPGPVPTEGLLPWGAEHRPSPETAIKGARAGLERGKGSEQALHLPRGQAGLPCRPGLSQALRTQALPAQPWTVRGLAVTTGQASGVP